MSRALIIVNGAKDRERVARWASKAPTGTRIEFKAAKRTLPQNDLMWALLTDVAQQKEHCGRKYSPDDWKALFLHALGQEMRFLPALDGVSFVPVGNRSSDLSKQEMTDLIELILAWGCQNGVTFREYERSVA